MTDRRSMTATQQHEEQDPAHLAIRRGLAFVDELPRKELRAFLGLFAGARFPWTSFNGEAPFIGKAECEWVDNWSEFYGVRLKVAGLFHFEMSEPQPALGMAPGSTFIRIDCRPTELARQVRDAWWVRFSTKLQEEAD